MTGGFYFDRVKETSTTTGLTSIALAGAVTGFRAFSSVYTNANQPYYVACDQNGPNWEVGQATYNGSSNTLSRSRVTSSSNSGAIVNFTSGALLISNTVPAEDLPTAAGPTGTGKLVLANAPSLTSASIGAANASSLSLSGNIPSYNNMGTAGSGVPAIYASGSVLNTGAAVSSVAPYTVGAAAGYFLICANVNTFAGSTYSFSVTVTYTDERGASRTLTLPFSNAAGTFGTLITNAAAGAFEGVTITIGCTASTPITIATAGTFTSVAYNVFASIIQIA